MEGIRNLWNEVIRRAVMYAKARGPIERSYQGKRGVEYRNAYREAYRRESLNFLSGGGNWEMACDVIGMDHIEYSKEILEGLNGHRKTLKRDAKRGDKWKKRALGN